MEEKTLVNLWDLPENKVYIKIEDGARIKLFNSTINRAKNITKLCEILKIKSIRGFYSYKSGQYSIPLRIVNNMLNLINLPDNNYVRSMLENNIKEIRSIPPSKAIKKIKFPIQSSSNLVSLISHIIGDGGFGKKNNTYIIHYTNKSKVLVNSFKKDVIEIFGDAVIYEWIDKRKNAFRIQLPNIVGIILEKICGYQSGNYKHIPDWIRNSNLEHKRAFIRALFDDEGAVNLGSIDGGGRFIRVGMTNIGVIIILKEMLEELDIYVGKIGKEKKVKRKDNFYLSITGKHDLEKFNELIGFNHPEKQRRLIQILDSYKIDSYRKSEMEALIIKTLSLYGNMNLYDLASKINRKPAHRIRTRLINLQKEGLIKSKSIGENHLKLYYLS